MGLIDAADYFASVAETREVTEATRAIEYGMRALHGLCLDCGSPEGVEREGTRTAYYFEPGTEDPNKPTQLCRPCAADYHAHWDEMWSYARGGE